MNKFLSAKQLGERYGVDTSTIWRWAAKKQLPAPVRLSDQCTRWRLEAVEEFEANRDAA
jgi:prophage regulatory protein